MIENEEFTNTGDMGEGGVVVWIELASFAAN
jgi:hypothetical protein